MSKPALQLPVLRNHAVLALSSQCKRTSSRYLPSNELCTSHSRQDASNIASNTQKYSHFFRCHRSVALGCNFGYLEAEVDIARNSVAG